MVENKLFNTEFNKASCESIGDCQSQIKNSISTIKIDGKDYPWDPNDLMFNLEDSITNLIGKRKSSRGFLGSEECAS